MDYYSHFDGTAAGNGDVSKGTAGIPGKDDDKKLFVGGLSRQTTDKELKEYFGKFGDIESVTVKVDPYTGQSRGFAFIVFSDAQTIDKLLSVGDHFINKRKVDPKRVSKKAQHGKIFVGGLTPEISDEDIKDFFSQYGNVVEIQAPFDKQKNQRKGFCFITFETKDVVYKLLKTPKQCIKGKEVDVRKVKVNPEMPGMGPGYPVGAGWGFGGYPGGYGYQDYTGYYGDATYDYTGYDYTGYGGYGNAAPQPYGATGKPRGGARQFQRHQPY
ncbi:RNA-binding protein squid-like [Lycorma delicatula]|uniref:RNA-binding protein squid-like n=1 Tax=Lycorma delicatula TaxID=130591 RepID=UPI003F50D6F4